jgi:DNA-binding response OmpR family regulator
MDTHLNIIVVEDHDDLRVATVEALSKLGHRVRGVDCAEALDDELGAFLADTLLLDLNLPGEDGLSLARRIRRSYPEIGILMITARDRVSDITIGYGSGADIYLTKPTSIDQITAALNALTRRLRVKPSSESIFRINPQTCQLTGPKAKVDVSANEFVLLSALAKAKGNRLETWQILESLGKSSDESAKATLEVQLVRLRKKLESAGADTVTIKAIRGSGYQLCIPILISKESG